MVYLWYVLEKVFGNKTWNVNITVLCDVLSYSRCMERKVRYIYVTYTLHVLFTHHQDSVANSHDPTVLTVICQLTGDKTSLRVLGAAEDAIYSGFGSCQAFPAEAFHRSGTNTPRHRRLPSPDTLSSSLAN